MDKLHDYYIQIVGYMGLTGVIGCDFFVQAKDDYYDGKNLF